MEAGKHYVDLVFVPEAGRIVQSEDYEPDRHEKLIMRNAFGDFTAARCLFHRMEYVLDHQRVGKKMRVVLVKNEKREAASSTHVADSNSPGSPKKIDN